MSKQVDVSFIGDFDQYEKRMQVVQEMFQLVADGNEEYGIQPTPAVAKYRFQILNSDHSIISAGYGEDKDIIRMSLNFSIKDTATFYAHVSHMIHVVVYDIDSGRFGEFVNDRYTWMLKNALSTCVYAIGEDQKNV